MSDTLRVSNLYTTLVGAGTTSPSAPIHAVSQSSTWVNMIQCFSPNITTQGCLILLGKASSNYNNLSIQYNHISDGSTNNFGCLQIGGVGNILNWAGNGNIGIGITNPSNRLHVFGDGPRIRIETNTGNNSVLELKTNANTSYLFTDQSGHLQIYPYTTSQYVLLQPAGGNVGIGTASPATALQVNGTVTATAVTIGTYPVIIPKVIYVGSQVLYNTYSGTTTNSGTASYTNLIGAYNENVIDGVFSNAQNPDTSQYFRAYYISCQVTTTNGGFIGVAINNVRVTYGATYSSSIYQVPIVGGYFLSWSQFPAQGAAGYAGGGLNIQIYADNTVAENFTINMITVHAVYLHVSNTTYNKVTGLTYSNSYRQFT